MIIENVILLTMMLEYFSHNEIVVSLLLINTVDARKCAMFIKKSKELDFHGLFVTSRVQHPRPNIYNHQQNYKVDVFHQYFRVTN